VRYSFQINRLIVNQQNLPIKAIKTKLIEHTSRMTRCSLTAFFVKYSSGTKVSISKVMPGIRSYRLNEFETVHPLTSNINFRNFQEI
jgi:hypothetical protein